MKSFKLVDTNFQKYGEHGPTKKVIINSSSFLFNRNMCYWYIEETGMYQKKNYLPHVTVKFNNIKASAKTFVFIIDI